MARPRTEASVYERFLARLPVDVMEILRERSAESGAPLNTELVRSLQRDMGLTQRTSPKRPLKQASHA